MTIGAHEAIVHARACAEIPVTLRGAAVAALGYRATRNAWFKRSMVTTVTPGGCAFSYAFCVSNGGRAAKGPLRPHCGFGSGALGLGVSKEIRA
jgi:hypothetical protein